MNNSLKKIEVYQGNKKITWDDLKVVADAKGWKLKGNVTEKYEKR